MKKKKNKINYTNLCVILALLIILMLLIILVIKEHRCKVYTFKYNNELHLSKKCYEKDSDFYCIYNGDETKVDYYYWEK